MLLIEGEWWLSFGFLAWPVGGLCSVNGCSHSLHNECVLGRPSFLSPSFVLGFLPASTLRWWWRAWSLLFDGGAAASGLVFRWALVMVVGTFMLVGCGRSSTWSWRGWRSFLQGLVQIGFFAF